MNIDKEAQKFAQETGIELPKLFIDLYKDKGNGGFGPEYEMLGIVNGHKTDLGDSILSLYKSYCQDDPDDPEWKWPRNLVPFKHVGCAIHYCVDCSDSNFNIIKFDPNGHGPGIEWHSAFKKAGCSFNEWISNNIK
ncbi:MAG: SMI1/KNR4 family protein [Candidatus Hodarchaeales archaeon]|jgi:hypothetical protein